MSNRELVLKPIKTLKDAAEITGGLSKPSKMPGFAFNIPAKACLTGEKLRKQPGTTCSKCYALKGRYAFSNTKMAMWRRFFSMAHPQWVEAMVFQINYRANQGHLHFRWFDSGDLQSIEHLEQIMEVCRRTPQVQHWMPSRELAIIRAAKDVPENLTIRYSMPKLGTQSSAPDLVVSTVAVNSPDVFQCGASERGGVCGDCRACWDKSIKAVNYPLH